jgi:signal peptidase
MKKLEEQKKFILLSKLVNYCISILFIIVIIFIISLIFQKCILKKDVPNIFGYKILQVMSGSMYGEFETGDTILIKEVKNESNLKIGDVVTYKVEENTLVTHRIVDITKTGNTLEYTTKGDANNTEDKEKVKFSCIEGIYVKKITVVGKLINFMQRPYGIAIICIIPILLIIYIIMQEKNKEERRNMRKEKRLNYEIEQTRKS